MFDTVTNNRAEGAWFNRAPNRIQMSRRKGWRIPANTVYVGRPGKFGNPFPVKQIGRDEAIQRYEEWIQKPEQKALFDSAKSTLRGKNLGCWCRPRLPCHADVLLRLVNDASGG